MEIVTYNFLKSKEFTHNGGWGNTNEYPIRSSSGNIQQLTECVFSFTEYNFLPCNGSQLDGHYTFYVNFKTFDYILYKSSDYGSLTYTTESKDTSFIQTLNEVDKKIVEAKIACKLLGAYYYDPNEKNSKGRNLIESNEEKYNCYAKSSLITDYRGYIWCDLKPNTKDSLTLKACSIIDSNFIPLEPKEIKINLNWTNRTKQSFTVKYENIKNITDIVTVNNIPFQYNINNEQHNFILIYQKTKGIIKKNDYDLHFGFQIKNVKTGEIFGNYTFKGVTTKDYIKTLPIIIASKYH